MRVVTLVLVVLLGLVQAELWFGKGGVPHTMGLKAELDAQLLVNADVRAKNERLAAEVADLKDGLEMVEERARSELGMIKPDELLVQLTIRR